MFHQRTGVPSCFNNGSHSVRDLIPDVFDRRGISGVGVGDVRHLREDKMSQNKYKEKTNKQTAIQENMVL